MKNKRFISLIVALSMIVTLFTGLTIAHAEEADAAGATWVYEVTDSTISIKSKRSGYNRTATIDGVGVLEWTQYSDNAAKMFVDLDPGTEYTVKVTYGRTRDENNSGSFVIKTSTPDKTCTVLENSFKKDSHIVRLFAPDDVITGSAKVHNGAKALDSVIYMVAIYDGNALLGVRTDTPDNETIGVGEDEILSVTVDLSDYPGADTIKSFVWNNLVGISALTNVKAMSEGVEREFIFGTLQTGPEHFQSNLDAGMNTALLELAWGSFYTDDGVKNTSYINEKRTLLAEMRDMGFKVMLGLGTQYSPSWIYNYPNSRYVNQYGDEYTTSESGDTAINAVFNSTIRAKLEEYVDDVFEEFGTDFDIIRLGWMRYGEIGYPNQTYNGNSNSYWAFDDIAQGKVEGLPEGIPVCPVPGWIPGTSSEGNADARAFIEWYLNALLNYQNWQFDLISERSDADLAILYPSWGIREGQLEKAINGSLSGQSSAEKTGELQRGFDFARLINGITNPKAIVYCTWIDANPEWTNKDDEEVPTTSNNFSPVHYMAYYTQQHPLNLKIMGENTGGGGMEAMNLTFERMKKYNLEGLMWAFERDLYNGVAPVVSDYAAAISDFLDVAVTITPTVKELFDVYESDMSQSARLLEISGDGETAGKVISW